MALAAEGADASNTERQWPKTAERRSGPKTTNRSQEHCAAGIKHEIDRIPLAICVNR